MAITQDTRERIIVPGPAGFHPPSAAQLGVALPDPGQGLYYGLLEPNEEVVIEEMARKMLTSPNATIFPGPLLLWAWNDHAVEKAKAIAGKDYVILLVDVYGKGQRPRDTEQAASMAAALYADRSLLRGRVIAAVEALRAQVRNDAPLDTIALGAIGFCFGGSSVLELARAGDEEAKNGTTIAGVVSFHGGLTTTMPAKPGSVRTSVLVLNGADDSNVKPEDITADRRKGRPGGSRTHYARGNRTEGGQV